MELVSQHATRTGAIKTPPAVLAAIVATAITAISIGALVWTSPRISPNDQVGNHLLSPALIQFRMSERTTETAGSAGDYLLDPAVISLRRGEKARLDRHTSAGSGLPDRPPVHVGNGPLAGGQ